MESQRIKNVTKFYQSDKYIEARAVRESAAATDLILVDGMYGQLGTIDFFKTRLTKKLETKK